MKAEFDTFDRENEQKNKLLSMLRKQLKTEQVSLNIICSIRGLLLNYFLEHKETRREQMQSGITFEELRDRLFKSRISIQRFDENCLQNASHGSVGVTRPNDF